MVKVKERVDDCLKLCGGTMPIVVVLNSNREKEWAEKYLKGKKHNKLITIGVR